MWWAGNGKMTWLIDFEGYALKNAPSMKARRTSSPTRTRVHVHYPARNKFLMKNLHAQVLSLGFTAFRASSRLPRRPCTLCNATTRSAWAKLCATMPPFCSASPGRQCSPFPLFLLSTYTRYTLSCTVKRCADVMICVHSKEMCRRK